MAGKPRRRRSERQRKPAPVSVSVMPTSSWPEPRFPIETLICLTSVEFLTVYNAYFDRAREHGREPEPASTWRQGQIGAWLA